MSADDYDYTIPKSKRELKFVVVVDSVNNYYTIPKSKRELKSTPAGVV